MRASRTVFVAPVGPTAIGNPGARLRFLFLPTREASDRHAAYHGQLVRAEILLDRIVAAQAAGLRAVAPTLDDADEARAAVKPPRGLFSAATLEYRRWYAADGSARAQPLTREALAEQLCADGMAPHEAMDRATHRSHALPAVDQAWLIGRRGLPLQQRPLNRREFHALVAAIDAAWHAPAGASGVARHNRRLALRVATLLAGMLDEYVAPPFRTAALNDAFSERLLAHLRQSIDEFRRTGAVCGVLLAGPKAWFAAKAARMRVEHQVALMLSTPGAPCAWPGPHVGSVRGPGMSQLAAG
ncbi:MAG: hypothetical protein ACTHJ9_15545 [Rhodanobacter sp.]